MQNSLGRRLFRNLYARVAGAIFGLILFTSLAQLLILTDAILRLGQGSEQQANWGIATVVAEKIQPLTSPIYDRQQTVKALFELHQLNPSLAIFLLDESGSVVQYYPDNIGLRRAAASVEALEEVLSSPSPELPVVASNPIESRITETLFSAARLEISGRSGYVYVVFTGLSSRTLAKRGQFLLTWIVVGSIAVVGVVAVLIGLVLFHWTTRRYRGFTAVLREFSAGDFSRRLDVSQQDDVSEVGTAINSLADSVVAARAELQERDRIRRNLVADISHDLRSPVSAMQLRLDVLAEVNEQTAFEAVGKHTPSLQRSLTALQRLVADLFELAKLETAKTLALQQVGIEKLIDGVVDQLTPLARNLEIGLVYQPQRHESTTVLLDPILIERMLTNLVENALRYSPTQSNITIRSGAESLLVVEVEDQGGGISIQQAETLFSRGERSSASSGAGLGLAIGRAIAEMHNGTLSYLPAATGGSIFRFEMPL